MKKIALCVVCTTLIASCCILFGGCNNNGLEFACTENSCSVISGINFKEKELNIPDEYDGKPVIGILEYSFMRNSAITTVSLPEGATFISAGAFYYCSQITTLNLPASVADIGYNAFSHCEKLETINYGGTKAQWYSVEKEYLWDDYSGEYTIVCTDGTLTKALNGNDLGTAGLSYEIYLKGRKCVLENGLSAVSENVEVSSKYYNYEVTTIGKNAFLGASIKSVNLPEGITHIDDGAFKACASLESVQLPSSVDNIGIEAFGGCASLTDIYYGGTREEWDNINKDPSWDNDASAYTVHCTDDGD